MRLYLIGAGVIARTHVEASKKLKSETFELRAADPNATVLADFATAFPETVTYSNYREMLAAEAPREDDIVIVATPPMAHMEPTIDALESGRHVLCEKPLAMNTEEANRMVEAAERCGRLLGCCSVRFKGMHHMETVKQIVRSGVLGDIYHMTFVNKWERSRSGIEYQPTSRWFLDSSRSGGGVLMDWGPYDFATLNDMLKPSVIEIAGAWVAKPETGADPEGVPFDVETHIGAFLTLRGGELKSPVHVHYERASCAHGEEYVKVEIEGTRGSVTWTPYDSRQPVFRRYDAEGNLIVEQVETPPRSEFTTMDRPLLHFYNKIRGEQSLANIGAYAADHFRCIQAVYACALTSEKQIVEMHAKENL